MEQIQVIRGHFAKFFIPFIWSHVVSIIVSSYLTESDLMIPLVLGVVLALVPTLFWLKDRTSPMTRYTSVVSMLGIVAVLVYQYRAPGLIGQVWQVDMHMYFFVILAMITGWCDWRALLVGAATAAVHHLGLNFLYPIAMFPEGASILRVILHAVMVVVESATLIWLVNLLVSSLMKSEDAVSDAEAAKAEGERLALEQAASQKAQAEKAETIAAILGSFDNDVAEAISGMDAATSNLETSAQAMIANTDETVSRTSSAGSAAEETAGNVNNVATAADQLSSSISEISSQVSQSSQIANEAVSEVEHTNAKVQGLSDAANKIGEVVALITDIADQTNLLALNATIEAARAGEAGKGFAVVASEVKNLANQTAKATEEISAHIGEIQGATTDAVQAIDSIGGTIRQVNEIAGAIAAAVEEQGAATSEIARSAEQAAEGTRSVSSSISGVAGAIDENKKVSDGVMSASTELFGRTDELRMRIETFLGQVKAV